MQAELMPREEETSGLVEINIGEVSVDPGASLDALGLDAIHNNEGKASFSDSDGHGCDFSFILTIGSPDSVRSTITIDPTLRFDATLLDEPPSDKSGPEIEQNLSNESSKSTSGRRLKPPVDARRWMDDSEHPRSVCSQASPVGILGLSNHLVPIRDSEDDTDDNSHYEYHNSNNSAESSAFEAESDTSDSFAAAYNDEPAHSYNSPKSRSKHSRRSHSSKEGERMLDLTLKMQQLKAANHTAAGTLPIGRAEDDNSPTQYTPRSGHNKFLDSLHSLNTLVSDDNILCNTTGHSTSTGGTFGSAE